MKPGTPHAVVTTKPSLAVGGHFYNHDTFTQTLQCLIREHYIGRVVTNDRHTDTGIILFKMAAKYAEMAAKKDFDLEKLGESPSCINTEKSQTNYLEYLLMTVSAGYFLNLNKLAHLVIIVMYFDLLIPDKAVGSSKGTDWQTRDEFLIDHLHAVEACVDLPKRLETPLRPLISDTELELMLLSDMYKPKGDKRSPYGKPIYPKSFAERAYMPSTDEENTGEED